jgi:hypothetical protein
MGKIGVQRESTSAIHKFQESLLFTEEISIVQYFYRVWNPMQLIRLIKMCLNETYIKVRVGKYLRDGFHIQNCLIQGDDLSQMF